MKKQLWLLALVSLSSANLARSDIAQFKTVITTIEKALDEWDADQTPIDANTVEQNLQLLEDTTERPSNAADRVDDARARFNQYLTAQRNALRRFGPAAPAAPAHRPGGVPRPPAPPAPAIPGMPAPSAPPAPAPIIPGSAPRPSAPPAPAPVIPGGPAPVEPAPAGEELLPGRPGGPRPPAPAPAAVPGQPARQGVGPVIVPRPVVPGSIPAPIIPSPSPISPIIPSPSPASPSVVQPVPGKKEKEEKEKKAAEPTLPSKDAPALIGDKELNEYVQKNNLKVAARGYVGKDTNISVKKIQFADGYVRYYKTADNKWTKERPQDILSPEVLKAIKWEEVPQSQSEILLSKLPAQLPKIRQELIDELNLNLGAGLKLNPQATNSQINKAFRDIARSIHPDKKPGKEKEEEFKKLTELINAYRKAQAAPGEAPALEPIGGPLALPEGEEEPAARDVKEEEEKEEESDDAQLIKKIANNNAIIQDKLKNLEEAVESHQKKQSESMLKRLEALVNTTEDLIIEYTKDIQDGNARGLKIDNRIKEFTSRLNAAKDTYEKALLEIAPARDEKGKGEIEEKGKKEILDNLSGFSKKALNLINKPDNSKARKLAKDVRTFLEKKLKNKKQDFIAIENPQSPQSAPQGKELAQAIKKFVDSLISDLSGSAAIPAQGSKKKIAEQAIADLKIAQEEADRAAREINALLVKQLEAQLQEKKQGIEVEQQEVVKRAEEQRNQEYKRLAEQAKQALAKAGQEAAAGIERAGAAAQDVAQNLAENLQKVSQEVAAAGQKVAQGFEQQLKQAQDAAQRLAQASEKAAQAGAEWASEKMNQATQSLAQVAKSTGKAASDLAVQVKQGASDAVRDFTQTLENASASTAQTLSQAAKDAAQKLEQTAQSLAQSADAKVRELASAARDGAKQLIDSGKDALARVAQQMKQAAQEAKERKDTAQKNLNEERILYNQALNGIAQYKQGEFNDKRIAAFNIAVKNLDFRASQYLIALSKAWQEGIATKNELDNTRNEVIKAVTEYEKLLEETKAPTIAPAPAPMPPARDVKKEKEEEDENYEEEEKTVEKQVGKKQIDALLSLLDRMRKKYPRYEASYNNLKGAKLEDLNDIYAKTMQEVKETLDLTVLNDYLTQATNLINIEPLHFNRQTLQYLINQVSGTINNIAKKYPTISFDGYKAEIKRLSPLAQVIGKGKDTATQLKTLIQNMINVIQTTKPQ